jgi:hypothetical protein
LVSPVNPETDDKSGFPIAIGATLWLDDDENLTGLVRTKQRCFVEQECADEVIEKSTDFRCWRHFSGMA